MALFTRLVLVLLAVCVATTSAGAAEPKSFVITKLTWGGADGNDNAMPFGTENNLAQPPASAVSEDIYIKGTIAPENPTSLTATIVVTKPQAGGLPPVLIGEYTVNNLGDGTWKVKIPKNKLTAGIQYKVNAQDGQVVINGTHVLVTEKTISVQNP